VAIYVSGDPQLGLLFGVKPKEWSLAAIVEGRWAFLHQGAILIFISSLAMWHAAKTTGRGTRRWPLMALAALAFVALLFTGTRAWVFGAIVVAIYFLALERRYLTISAGVGVGLLVALICSNIRIPSENGLAPIVRSFSIPWFNFSGAERSVHAGGSWNWRVDLWKLALDQIKRTPLWGAGFRLDPYVRSVLTSTYVARNRSYYNYLINLASGSTHQLWLGPFHTFGVLGGLLFLIYYIERVAAAWKLAVTTCRERSEYAGSALFIAAWLIYGTAIGFVDGGTTAMRFYIPAGLSHLLAYAVNNKIEKPSAGPPAEAAGGSKAIESQ
jgi:O-antigen ligase